MARHRKGKPKHRRHHKRVGAIHGAGMKDAAMGILGVTAGYAVGRFINNMVNPTTVTTNTFSPTIMGLVEAVGGAVVVMKSKNTFVKAIGAGFGGNGVMYTLGARGLALLPASIGYGPPNTMVTRPNVMQGFRDVPRIGYFPKPAVIGNPDRDRMRMSRMYAGVYG